MSANYQVLSTGSKTEEAKTKRAILELFANDEDLLSEVIEELDSFNGYLNDYRYYDMEMLNEFFIGTEPSEILYRAFYGYDDDTWHTDSIGNKIYGAFNPNRNYFYYNGYGNLVSSDYKDYSAFVDSFLIDSLIEERANLYTIDNSHELCELFDRLEELETEGE